MQYSMPIRIGKPHLEKGDEIKVRWADKDAIIQYAKDYPDKHFVLCVPITHSDIRDKELLAYKEATNNKFTLELEDIMAIQRYGKIVPCYWKLAPANFYELQSLIELGVSQILINGFLFFNLKTVRKIFNGKIRLIPNLAFDDYLPHKTGICGVWMRPQDKDLYEDYIDIIEFKADTFDKYRTLFHIYAEVGDWSSDMRALILNFKEPVLGSVIPREVVERRLDCRQVCAEGRCHYCSSGIAFGKIAGEQVINEFIESL